MASNGKLTNLLTTHASRTVTAKKHRFLSSSLLGSKFEFVISTMYTGCSNFSYFLCSS